MVNSKSCAMWHCKQCCLGQGGVQLGLMGFGLLLLLFSSVAGADSIALRWVPAASDARVEGYEVHYGLSSGVYGWSVTADDQGAATDRQEIDGLEPGQTYYFAVRSRGKSVAEVSAFSNEVSVEIPTWNEFLEIGEVSIDHEWRRVDLKRAYRDPVVVAKPLSANGSDPAVVCITDVDPTGFLVRVQEWDYLNQSHVTETVGYMVMERGRHQLDDGTWVEAGRLDTRRTDAFEKVDFADAFASPPVVFAAVTSVNGSDVVSTRVRRVGVNGFEVGLAEQEKNKPRHVTETIDYIALEISSGVMNGRRFEVGRTPEEVTHRVYTLAYQSAFNSPPVLIAGMQTVNGRNTASMRWHHKSSDAVDLWIEEEKSKDAETVHKRESIGYFLIEPGN